MKALIISTISFLSLISQGQPQAYFDYKIFYLPGTGTYIETYLDFTGEKLIFNKLPNGMNQARVIANIAIKENETTINFSKKEILSPEIADSTTTDFLDLQRINLKPGHYTIEIELEDHNRLTNNKITFSEAIDIPQPPATAFISDLLYLGKSEPAATETPFTKSGFNLYPLVSNSFPQYIDKLMFYAEVYNTLGGLNDTSSTFLLIYQITNASTGVLFREYQKVLRRTAAEVVPIIGTFNIAELPSGKFYLRVEVRNSKNELVASCSNPFTRSNPNVVLTQAELSDLVMRNSFVKDINGLDTLEEFLNCLRPIAGMLEKAAIDDQKKVLPTLDDKKRFFYEFWVVRNSTDPAHSWLVYKQAVNLVNYQFKTSIKKGYETDRGRVYLQYGPPNIRQEVPTEPSTYPYEIWQYDHIENLNNRKFIFYNQALATNEFELLHSDMFGEPRNQNWQRVLAKRVNPMDNPDKLTPEPQFGNRSDEFFRNPR